MTESTASVDSLRSQWVSDLKLIGGIVLATYVVFFALGVVGGLTLNQIVGNLQRITFFAAVYALGALALNLHWGYTGLFNVGLVGYMAVAVYTMAIVTAAPDGTPAGLGLPLPVGVVGGMIAAAIVGGITALPALRLRSDYFAIVTLGFSEIIRLTLASKSLSEVDIGGTVYGTGGGGGFRSPSPDVIADHVLYADYMLFDPDRTGDPNALGDVLFGTAELLTIEPSIVRNIVYTSILIGFVALFFLFLTRIGYSPFGRVLKAIREDEVAARSLGKNTNRAKIVVFMVGCALLGLAGMLWQGRFTQISPDQFMPITTFYIFVALIVGGSGSNTGSIVGGFAFAAFLYQGPRYLRTIVETNVDLNAPPTIYDGLAALTSADPVPLVGYLLDSLDELRFVLIGVVLIVLMIKRPEGLFGHRKEIAAATDLSRRPATDGGRPAGAETAGTYGGDGDE